MLKTDFNGYLEFAQKLFDGMDYTSKSGTLNTNMTEAAARAYVETLKK